jgi:hypothetical protein
MPSPAGYPTSKHREHAETQRGTTEGRRAARARWSDPALNDERARHLQRRKIQSHRRPVSRSEGSRRRLLVEAKSKEEALEWASRIPGSENEMVEVRRFFEMSDFSSDVQKRVEELEQKSAEAGTQLGQK